MRVTTSKSKNSESFYITHSYINHEGKSTSKIFKRLGTLADLSKKLNTDRDGVMAWAKEQAKIETDKYNAERETIRVPLSPIRKIDKDKDRTFNVGYLFLQSILSDLRVDNITRNIKSRYKYEYNLESILKDLIYSRILKPSSKRSSYNFAQTLLEKPKYELHDVYRALSILSQESDYIQSEIYKNSNFISKRNTEVLYYDCTNYYFEIEQEDDFKKYGKSKENRPNPIVGMGLFMDADGMPLGFHMYPGNQNEQITLRPLEEKIIRDFGVSKFVLSTDGGLGSKSNKQFNTAGGRGYVVTQSLKKLKKDDKEIALKPTQWRAIGSKKFINLDELDETDPVIFETIYYKEIPLDSKNLSENLIVTYSPKYKNYLRTIRSRQIERAHNAIRKDGQLKKQRKNPNDPARFFVETAITDSGEVARKKHYQVDPSIIDEEAKYDGFYAVVTNLDDSVEDVIKVNKYRWKIEECFRIMKTEFEARPVYLSREDRINAHFLTCFLALVVYRHLEYKLNVTAKKKNLDINISIDQIISTLKNMNTTLIDSHGYIPAYTRTELTDLLHDTFGFNTDYEIMKKSTMRNIIKKSKEK